jgi:AsmA protein
MNAAYQSTRLVGHADANVSVNGVGNTNAAIMRSLSGKLDANVKQGAINGIDITYAVQSASALLKREIPARGTGPARTEFKSLQTSATIDKGVVHTEELRMETDFLQVSGKGTLDLVTEALDYQLVAAAPREAPARARSGNELAGLDVPLRITGTVSNPTVRPDLEALAKGQLRQQVQQKAGEVVKKQLGDKLKDLFNH